MNPDKARRPALLLHGFGGGQHDWQPLLPLLVPRPLLIPDLPGHGHSPPLATPSLTHCAHWLRQQLDAAGVAGAPKFGDAAAWAPRIATGYEALLTSALKGKGAMGAQAGGAFSDIEIGRAVVHMANAGGAKFSEPKGE